MLKFKEYAELKEYSNPAFEFAIRAHKGQVRSGGEPYHNHVERVAKNVIKFKKSHRLDDLIKAAYLHDTVEDTNTTLDDIKTIYGGLVASLVDELTSDSDAIDKMGKAKYLADKMINMSSWALVIKLADRLDNVSDLKTAGTEVWRNRYYKETKNIIRNLKSNRELSPTHKKMVASIEKKLREFED